jgi:hypothetical protein
MFTGIVRAVGEVVRIEEANGIRAFDIRVVGSFLDGVEVGASIALDGACLTPILIEGDTFRVEAVRPTLEKTIAGSYQVGNRINLEHALTLNGRLDGHFVQGHVDGMGYGRIMAGLWPRSPPIGAPPDARQGAERLPSDSSGDDFRLPITRRPRRCRARSDRPGRRRGEPSR